MESIDDLNLEKINEKTITLKSASSFSYLSASDRSSKKSDEFIPSHKTSETTIPTTSDAENVHKPIPVQGYVSKQRRSPMKGFHKRFFYLTDGCFVYAKSRSQLEGSEYLKEIFALCNAAITMKEPKIFIDAGSIVHKIKLKSIETCKLWAFHFNEHRTYSLAHHSQNDSIPHLLKYVKTAYEISDRWNSTTSINETKSTREEDLQVSFKRELKELEKIHASLNSTINSLHTPLKTANNLNVAPVSIRLDSNDEHSDNESATHLTPVKTNKFNNILSRSRSKRASPSDRTSATTSPQEQWKHDAERFVSLSKNFIETANKMSKIYVKEADDLKGSSNYQRRNSEVNKIQSLTENLTKVSMKNRYFNDKIRLLKEMLDDIELDKNSFETLKFKTNHPSNLSSSSSANSFYDAQEYRTSDHSGSECSVTTENAYSDFDQVDELEKTKTMRKLDPTQSLAEAESKRRRASQTAIASRNSLGHRTVLPVPRPSVDNFNMMNLLYKNIGTDLSKIRLPVILNEPLSALQRLCEELEYSRILDEGAQQSDPYTRMAYVAAFAVSMYSSTTHRASTKPFNPILGETFECIREERGWKFMSEQISHHPPSAVCSCIHKRWRYQQEVTLKNKFWGKSLEAIPDGYIQVCYEELDETYVWSKVTTCIYNLMGSLSKRTIENYGTCTIECKDTGLVCKLNFHKADWSGKNQCLVTGQIQRKDGQGEKVEVHGYWNKAFYLGDKSHPNPQCLWSMNPMPVDYLKYYGFSQFAIELNEDPDPNLVEKGNIPVTDSRLRPDQRYLEVGQIDTAENEKTRIENLQRERIMYASDNGHEYLPKWFHPKSGTNDNSPMNYTFDEKYWKVKDHNSFRDERIEPIW